LPEGPDRRPLQWEPRPEEGPPDRRDAGGSDPGCCLDRCEQAPAGRSSQGFVSGGAVHNALMTRHRDRRLMTGREGNTDW